MSGRYSGCGVPSQAWSHPGAIWLPRMLSSTSTARRYKPFISGGGACGVVTRFTTAADAATGDPTRAADKEISTTPESTPINRLCNTAIPPERAFEEDQDNRYEMAVIVQTKVALQLS